MNCVTKRHLRGGVVFGLASAWIALNALPAAAAEGDVTVVNTETVQVYTDATGKVETKRVYEQIEATGTGTVDLVNPIETDGLRNLDGFGGFDVKDGQQLAELTVDGKERLRTVSTFTGDLPLDLQVEYTLDGKRVEPGDVVGESGKLQVKYIAKNITSKPQEVSFDDGNGGTVTRTVDVPIPLVGSLTTVAPSNFTNVQSEQANKAGDGKGGTKLSFTVTLFPPIGSDRAEFGYTADVSDAVVPHAAITVLPVNPLEVPSFKSAAASYEGGAETGIELTDGASTIDENLLKLRDGAGQLLAGLIQLRDGATKLEAGLTGEAAPGARQLADGAGELGSGIGRIDEGAGKLSAGATKLSVGAGKLSTGLQSAESKAPALLDGLETLRGGLVKVDQGLKKLSIGVGGVRNNEKYKALRAGLDKMLDGVGDTGKVGSLTWAVDRVRSGLSAGLPKIKQMADGVYLNSASEPGAYQKLGCATYILGLMGSGDPYPPAHPCIAGTALVGFAPVGLDAAGATSPVHNAVLDQLVLQLEEGRAKLATPDGAVNETTLYGGLMSLYGQLGRQDPSNPGALLALTTVECALDSTSLGNVCEAVRPGGLGLRQGLQQVVEGVPTLVNTIIGTVQGAIGRTADTPDDGTLRGGLSGLIGGTDLLSQGGAGLLEGLGLLADGAGQLDDGAGRLSDGVGQLADGTGKASAGSSRLAAGADRLADGLGDAADGSGRIADGLTKAADAAPKLEDGAQRLSTEGTSKLVEAGQSTAQNYGEMHATILAGAERADNEKMQYGAPEGAVGLAAYSYEIKGEDGEGGRNFARGLGGLVLLGVGMTVFGLRRRLA